MFLYSHVNPAVLAASGTLRKNIEAAQPPEPKLENPYYYYGSTRNQKKAKMIAQQQKPRPLLPSQRAALEMQQRAPAFVATQLPGERPKYVYTVCTRYTFSVKSQHS